MCVCAAQSHLCFQMSSQLDDGTLLWIIAPQYPVKIIMSYFRFCLQLEVAESIKAATDTLDDDTCVLAYILALACAV